eukprot:TRINITY_DN6697_c0_g1_i3.p1 TRINITY_DN6697_c0_g1~~TRINITY_DN6697_c0_g1_i3.p1  ORF type:complete len:176 (-),score=33.34 TRINITY_DN6697_c0_g1_i3:24-494(-)
MCIRDRNSFREMMQYLDKMVMKYQISLEVFERDFKKSLEKLVSEKDLKFIIMGTRRTDPFSSHLKVLAPSDEGWPSFTRILPILDWDYAEVWSFIRTLGIEYCALYDMGFTYIGNQENSSPNPKLFRKDTGDYLPAYEGHPEDEYLSRCTAKLGTS